MATEKVLEENSNEVTAILYPMKKEKKGRIKKFFSNEDVILVLFSIGASALIIILMLIAAALGTSFPSTTI